MSWFHSDSGHWRRAGSLGKPAPMGRPCDGAAIASALGTGLIAHAFVRRTVVSYLAYIANLP